MGHLGINYLTVHTQTDMNSVMRSGLIETSQIPVEYIIYGLLAIVFFIGIFTYASYRYQKWRRYQKFIEEMQTLDLDPDQEGTFADLVKRYNMDEPVNIIYSKRLYDELASQEMIRILASPGTVEAKAGYIETLYEIRDKTYTPEWLESVKKEPSSESKTSA